MTRITHLGFGIALVTATPFALALPPEAGGLIWEDHFDGSSLDNSKWDVHFEGTWGSGENDASSVSVGDSHLKLTTYTNRNTHYAPVISTFEKQDFTYGYFEARIQFNGAPGMWSAFWMEAPNVGGILGNPAESGTEIDIAEYRATDDQGNPIQNQYLTAVHWDGYGEDHKWDQELHGPFTELADGDRWNTYGLLWTPEKNAFYFNGELVWERTTEISQIAHYLLLSSEVMDNSWAGSIPAGGYGSLADSEAFMLVDWVQVYELPEPTAVSGLVLLGMLAAGRRVRNPRIAP